jgi:hypothetical protein
MLNTARHVKYSVKDFFFERWLDYSEFYVAIFSWKRLLLCCGLLVSLPPGHSCIPELIKLGIIFDYDIIDREV